MDPIPILASALPFLSVFQAVQCSNVCRAWKLATLRSWMKIQHTTASFDLPDLATCVVDNYFDLKQPLPVLEYSKIRLKPVPEIERQILADVHRTIYRAIQLGLLPEFETEPEEYENLLASTLCQYASIHSDVSFNQGMSYIGLLITCTRGWSFEACNVAFTDAMNRDGVRRLYENGLNGLAQLMYRLSDTIERQLPALSRHFESLEIQVSMFATRWFLTLFSSLDVLNFECAVLVMDFYAAEGTRALLRVARVLLDEKRSDLMDATNVLEVLKVTSRRSRLSKDDFLERLAAVTVMD